MTTFPRRLRLLLVSTAALALLVTACGGDDPDVPADDVPADDAPADDAPADDAAADDAAADDLDLISDGELLVGSDIAFEPFEFVEDGENKGFDIDLMTAIAENLGLEVEFVNTPFDGIFTALAGGQFDAVISATTITEEREQTIAFSDPYFEASQAIAAAEGSDVAGPEDLAGLDVGVQAGTTGEEYATENFDDASIQSFPTSEAAFSALEGDQIDVVFIDIPVVEERVESGGGLVLAGAVDTGEQYGIGVQQDNDALREAINAELEALIADGTYAEIYGEWFPNAEVPEAFAG